jgi:hypothetical protein
MLNVVIYFVKYLLFNQSRSIRKANSRAADGRVLSIPCTSGVIADNATLFPFRPGFAPRAISSRREALAAALLRAESWFHVVVGCWIGRL